MKTGQMKVGKSSQSYFSTHFAVITVESKKAHMTEVSVLVRFDPDNCFLPVRLCVKQKPRSTEQDGTNCFKQSLIRPKSKSSSCEVESASG